MDGWVAFQRQGQEAKAGEAVDEVVQKADAEHRRPQAQVVGGGGQLNCVREDQCAWQATLGDEHQKDIDDCGTRCSGHSRVGEYRRQIQRDAHILLKREKGIGREWPGEKQQTQSKSKNKEKTKRKEVGKSGTRS